MSRLRHRLVIESTGPEEGPDDREGRIKNSWPELGEDDHATDLGGKNKKQASLGRREVSCFPHAKLMAARQLSRREAGL